MSRTVAVLYVDPLGPYPKLPDVDRIRPGPPPRGP